MALAVAKSLQEEQRTTKKLRFPRLEGENEGFQLTLQGQPEKAPQEQAAQKKQLLSEAPGDWQSTPPIRQEWVLDRMDNQGRNLAYYGHRSQRSAVPTPEKYPAAQMAVQTP